MAFPLQSNESKSDMRSFKPGWYAMDEDGSCLPGRFPAMRNASGRISKTTLATSDPREIAPCHDRGDNFYGRDQEAHFAV